jgi:F-type H+-transporting ATPase subunit epsilon
MKLEIITPEKVYFSGDVSLVTLPGTLGSFTLLENHAPIISPLQKGTLIYRNQGKDINLQIESGFAEMNNNIVTVCIENVNE